MPPLPHVLRNFVESHAHATPGRKILFRDFYARFCQSLPGGRPVWSRTEVASEMRRAGFALGVANGNRLWIGNLSWSAPPPYVAAGRRLVLAR